MVVNSRVSPFIALLILNLISLATELDLDLQVVMLLVEDTQSMTMTDVAGHPVDTLLAVMDIVIEALLDVVITTTIVHVMRALQEPVVHQLMTSHHHEDVMMILTVAATIHLTHTLMAVLHMIDHLHVTTRHQEMSLMSIVVLPAIEHN